MSLTCSRCGYSLRGLPVLPVGVVCPECGSPNDPLTNPARGAQRTILFVLLVNIVPMMALTMVGGITIALIWPPWVLVGVLLVLFVHVGVTPVLSVMWWVHTRRHVRRISWTQRLGVCVLLYLDMVILALLTLWVWTGVVMRFTDV